MHPARSKKMKFQNEETDYFYGYRTGEKPNPAFSLSKLLAELDDGKYGSVTKEYDTLNAQRVEMMNMISTLRRSFASPCASPRVKSSQVDLTLYDQSNQEKKVNPEKHLDTIIILDSDEEDGDHQTGTVHSFKCEFKAPNTTAWLESQSQMYQRKDKLDCGTSVGGRRPPCIQYEKVVLRNVIEKQAIPHERIMLKNESEKQQTLKEKHCIEREENEGEDLHKEVNVDTKSALRPTPISFVGIQDCSTGMESHNEDESPTTFVGIQDCSPGMESRNEDESPISSGGIQDCSTGMENYNEDDTEISGIDGLQDLWKDMSLAIECSKVAILPDESAIVKREEECEHSFVLEDDVGLVCRICGIIQKNIETIFDFQWKKGTRTRTYMPVSRHSKDINKDILNSEPKFSELDPFTADISVHPRHMKQTRSHQIEGFNFLVRNLLSDKPSGCILAHAPGSGKTFMVISFIQSFLAKTPNSRPLIILPKGILATWKKEFKRWQVEEIPLHDFYSLNANNRSQQLDVLKIWQEHRSILLLSYQQFANIVCGCDTDKIAASCQERLLRVPSLLIMDEGHTPRNEHTNVLSSLGKVQTPCKVILSGTIFQNHVKEVFNIVNLVRPNFLKIESSLPIVHRIMSRVNISGRRLNKACSDTIFYDLVEATLRNDDNYKRKIAVIQDLRELTENVLHYYKGDFLEDLPGFVDFTVLLNLNPKQKEIVRKLGRLEKFKRTSVANAVYIHPYLKDISEQLGTKAALSLTRRLTIY